MKPFRRFWLFIVLLTGCFSAPVDAQSATVISDTEAAQHVGQQATGEGTEVKVFISKNEAVSVSMPPTRSARHYRELMTPDQAEKFWSIRPATETKLAAISA